MTVRVVVYAEGSGERAGNLTLLPAPGESLSEDHLGPVHVLVRRALVAARGVPESAVQFEAPLRLARGGREPRGSDLQHRRTLRQLLRWPRADFRPDLAIVIVDADDELDRARRLEMETQDIGVSRVIAAAVREFESWLIADTRAVRKTLTLELSTTKDPEGMNCREAKELLNGWVAARLREERGLTARGLRRTLADECDLDDVARRCPSFADLRHKLVDR